MLKWFLCQDIKNLQSRTFGLHQRASRFTQVLPEIGEDELLDRSFMWEVIRTLRRKTYRICSKIQESEKFGKR